MIPLHYLGIFPFACLTLNGSFGVAFRGQLTKIAKDLSSAAKDRKVLFLGSGNMSLCHTFIPLLCSLGVEDITVVLTSERHRETLEILCKEFPSKFKPENIFKASILQDPSHPFQSLKYDLVIDSMASEKQVFTHNSRWVTEETGVYWAMQLAKNIYHIQAKTNKGMQSLMPINKELMKLREIQDKTKVKCFTPGLYSTNYIDQMANPFLSFEKDKDFPVFVDKMYALDDIQHAISYVLESSEHMLGENIAFLINKEDDESFHPFKVHKLRYRQFPKRTVFTLLYVSANSTKSPAYSSTIFPMFFS